jgi:hypothetical protein
MALTACVVCLPMARDAHCSVANIPSEVKVGERTIDIRDAVGRWYDIPLSMAEVRRYGAAVTLVASKPYTAGNPVVVHSIQGMLCRMEWRRGCFMFWSAAIGHYRSHKRSVGMFYCWPHVAMPF